MLLSGVDTSQTVAIWTSGRRPTAGVDGYEGYSKPVASCRNCSRRPAITPTWSQVAHGQGTGPNPGGGVSNATSLCLTGRQLLGHDQLHGASPLSVFTEDGRYLTELPQGYYATKTYTDKLIGFIEATQRRQAFLCYVSTRHRTIRSICPGMRTATSLNTIKAGMRFVRRG